MLQHYAVCTVHILYRMLCGILLVSGCTVGPTEVVGEHTSDRCGCIILEMNSMK